MKKFEYISIGKEWRTTSFSPQHTPVSFADEVVRCVTSPRYLDGKKRFALVVWGRPV